MPAPKRADLDDFYAQLTPTQHPHLVELQRISLSYAPAVEEKLQWNQPAYLRDGERLWMLQAYGKHCSLRFTPEFFGAYTGEVADAGYECGAGFLKIRYDQDVPEALCRRLIEARLAE
ncbi:DUF1801 domain-containing protein [Gordonia desulfuricans]|uniref:DUF1801 domain-containing protein n=1 Tax=Gordonia desulfuricans TaxID=89051 RepID=A0A7K3LS66_9ACTN|nr:DUF1801 domain-containing protein [Gordonia desulfuricans]NDK91098.1 DUF1801 domain-containing protein [Gordonia desulfuricans]